jgi:tRNA A-37 threonylcarbamoyl transferase component Bud32
VRNGQANLNEVKAGGLHWLVRPDCREQLLGPDGLRLEEWLRTGLAQVVKHGPHRTVYRIALPKLSVYLKHYRLPDLRSWLRQLVRPAKARMEYERALAVAERAIPTVAPLALGEGGPGAGPSESFLITQSLEGAEPLSTFIEHILPPLGQQRQTLIRQRLARALGVFVARLHDAGILHNDFHAANLLVRLEKDDRPCLFLIDLHAACLGRSLSWSNSRENLVILNRWFVLHVSRSDRCRFWRSYRQARAGFQVPEDHGSPARRRCRPALAQILERATWHSNLRFWDNRDRRSLVTNRHYYRVQFPGLAGWAVRDLEPSVLAQIARDPATLFRQRGVRILKDSPSSTVAELDVVINGLPRRVICKRFIVTAGSEPWLALVRQTAALRSWMYGHGLRERGLRTARPLAVFHRRRFGLSYDGYLLTEKIPEAVDLHEFMADLQRRPAQEARRLLRQRLDQVAGLVRELHRRQISHRDLKAGNLLLTAEGPWLIDLVGVRVHGRLSRGRRVQNLSRLHASFCQDPRLSRGDKLRFLRVYLQWGLFGRRDWKEWWRDVERATRAKIARNLRSGRPLS